MVAVLAPVQTAKNNEATAATSVTLDSGQGWAAPTPGNLIVVVYSGNTTLANLTMPSGFSSDRTTNNGNNSSIIGRKIADGTETSLTATSSVSANQRITAYELPIREAPGSVIGPSVVNSSTTAQQSETLSATTPAKYAGIAIASIDLANTYASWTSWSDGFIDDGGTTRSRTAHLFVSPGQTCQTTGTWVTSRSHAGVLIVYYATRANSPVARSRRFKRV